MKHLGVLPIFIPTMCIWAINEEDVTTGEKEIV